MFDWVEQVLEVWDLYGEADLAWQVGVGFIDTAPSLGGAMWNEVIQSDRQYSRKLDMEGCLFVQHTRGGAGGLEKDLACSE
jgi:hypothetical protein